MIKVNVQGGTNAGTRTVKTKNAWVCGCPDVVHPGSRYSCPTCKSRRP